MAIPPKDPKKEHIEILLEVEEDIRNLRLIILYRGTKKMVEYCEHLIKDANRLLDKIKSTSFKKEPTDDS